ncbi:FAD-binding oxidoreductase [Candidatus Ferrigenium straubiae]|jgi:NAD(P)H-flavin reductase/ferredoxin|uniref:FAD-binding oxidoreductase n=1 Tax=Candidatus Ferrigenium straubiae TaxID=2919506 RepID=UPI003F4A97BD
MIKLVHRIGQGIFLRLESAFNGIFGPALNPFYYLGAITYLMFWIIVVSGFYIYAFYDTGVNDAFDSVEQLTNKQWYLGGIMRSLHRYASDGMIVFGVLHLLRNFAFDRYRGFRWFSWYTGILVLWLIYIAGINGYWLPWDKLAQFAAVGTAEWLDALPIFSAPLVRNFLEQGSVNDRFFSLLSFIHLGIPLGAFAIIWVHTQRVPQAKTSPPKAITIWLILSMVVLSLIHPALSQGHADLDSAPMVLNLDWFYFWSYPLLYSWNPSQVWILVGGVSGLLLLLPFLGGRRGKGEYEIITAPAGHTVMAKPGETVLEAALRQGLNLPYVCRDGACGVCKGNILKGTVDYGTYQKGVLTDAEKAEGKALFCCAKPLSDLAIECTEVDELGKFPVKTMKFRVEKMERAAPEVMLIELRPEGGEQMNFIAGQYIAVHLEDGSKRSYSIANAPHESDHLQLHIRLVEGGKFTTHVFNKMKVGDVLQAEGPLGTFFLREEVDKPIIFMSGGCGFGSVKGMVEHAFKIGLNRPMTLYWGARTPADLYSDLPEKWQREHNNFKFIPVISEPKPEDGWQGRTGLVHEAILQDYPQLDGYQVYACGSSGMVEAGRAPFMAKGLPEDQYFSDAFTVACYKAPAAEASVSSEGVTHG